MHILFISAFVVLSSVVTAQIEPPFMLGIRDVMIGDGAGYTEVELYKRNEKKRREDDEWIHVASNVTNAVGITSDLVTPTEFPFGVYKLILQTGKYYEARNISTFYPYLEILFKKSTPKPLLIVVSLSPYGFSYDQGK